MLDVEDIDFIHQSLKDKGIQVTSPKWLEFKWFFNMLTRRMPWRNCYVPFFDSVPFQIGFQEMKDDNSRDFMNQYMVPNSKDNRIDGIYHAIIKGRYTDKGFDIILSVFGEKAHKEKNSLKVDLNENQTIEFLHDECFQIELFTNINDGNSIKIENLAIHC